MMKQSIQWLLFVTAICFFAYAWTMHKSLPAVQYFPIDETHEFSNYKTKLRTDDKLDEIDWIVYSKSSGSAYLRQDISLLYINGVFSGLFSAWRERVSELSQKKRFPIRKNSYYNAISYHHGEFHDDDKITSIQTMSDAELFTYEHDNLIESFTTPETNEQRVIADMLVDETTEQLKTNWQRWIDTLQIDTSNYDCMPLTAWTQIEQNETFKQLPRAVQQRVIGQFWEGLYKNYVIRLSEKKNNAHYVPLILLDKNVREIRILFELEDEPEQLIQRISVND